MDNQSSDAEGRSSPTRLEPSLNPNPRFPGVPIEPTVIGRMMPTSQIVAHLGDHGCQDVTALLDMSTSSTWPISTGGFGDVYKVKLYDSTEVAVKTTRVHIGFNVEGKKHLKHAARELHTWAKCNHPNVLKLIGLAIFRDQIGMVSLWMENGSLPTYLSKNPDADRHEISTQISEGLVYLHASGIVHGDLKGMNVLVSDDGIPVLTDFGNAVVSNRSLLFTATTSAASISLRWTAPELLDQEGPSTNSQEADVYALGMTILETITGQVPYPGKVEHSVMVCVCGGKLPDRPKEMPSGNQKSDILWSILKFCWSNDPKERPSAAQVAKTLSTISRASAADNANPTQMKTVVGIRSPGAPAFETGFDTVLDENHSPIEQAPGEATAPAGPARVDPQNSLAYIIAGQLGDMVFKHSFNWSWFGSRSGISIGLTFQINSDVIVPAFKSVGAPFTKSLLVKYDRARGKPHGFSRFDGAIGQNRLYIEIPEWLIEISGPIEGGPDDGKTFSGSGTWLSS